MHIHVSSIKAGIHELQKMIGVTNCYPWLCGRPRPRPWLLKLSCRRLDSGVSRTADLFEALCCVYAMWIMNVTYRCTHRTRSTRCWPGTVCVHRRQRQPVWPLRHSTMLVNVKHCPLHLQVHQQPIRMTLNYSLPLPPIVRLILPVILSPYPVSAVFNFLV